MSPDQHVMRIFSSSGEQLFESKSLYTQKYFLKIGDEEREVNVIKPQLSSSLDCSVCLETATDPVTMCPASHIVCRKCVKFELCPMCRYNPKTADSPDTFPRKDKRIKSFELSLEATPWLCPVGCKMLIDHNDLKKHASKCKPHQCSTCREVKVSTRELLSRHEAVCPEKEIACRKCELKMKQRYLKEHQSRCPEAEVDVNPALFGMEGPDFKLKRKIVESIPPECAKYMKDLFGAFVKRSGKPDQNPDSNERVTPVSGSSLSIPRQNIKVLAEIEFTKDDLNPCDQQSRQNLLNIPISPVSVYDIFRKTKTYDIISIMIQTISYKSESRDIQGFVCKLNSQTEESGAHFLDLFPVFPIAKSSQPAANKPYTFTLRGISEGNCETLMKIRLSVNKILHDNNLSDFGKTINNSTPLDARNFYQIFREGFAGYNYIHANNKPRLKLTVTEES